MLKPSISCFFAVVLLLCAAGCGPNIYDAAAFGDLETVQQLAEANPDLINTPNKKGKTALFFAATTNRTPIVEYLLENGADVSVHDETGLTALHVAARMGHAGQVERLIEAGADPNAKDHFGGTPMHIVAFSRFGGRVDRRTAVVEVLMAAGASPHAENNNGKTPLDLAYDAHRDDGIETFEAFKTDGGSD